MWMRQLILLLPILICLYGGYAIKKTDEQVLAGFNDMPKEQQQRLKERGYIEKNYHLT